MERKAENMQKAIIEELNVIMDENENVVVVNADLGLLFKDGKNAAHHPERVFDCGISEPSMIGTAAGLALSGKIPYTTTIAEMAVTRVLENIRLDAAYQHLNMTMFGQGRGVAYGVGGSTHVITEDISMLRAIPGLTIIFPADAYEARKAIKASVNYPGPKYISFARGVIEAVNPGMDYDYEIGRANTLREGKDITLVACGDMVVNALDAAEELEKKGISSRVINMHTLKPLDAEAIIQAAGATKAIVTIETHNKIGGLGAAVAQVVAEKCTGTPMKFLGIEDEFVPVGDEPDLHKHYGLDVPGIVAQVEAFYKTVK